MIILALYALIILSLFGLLIRARGQRMVHAPATFDEMLALLEIDIRHCARAFALELLPAFRNAQISFAEFGKSARAAHRMRRRPK